MKPRDVLTWTIALAGSVVILLGVFLVFEDLAYGRFPRLSSAVGFAPHAVEAVFLMLIPATIATVIALLLQSTRGTLQFKAFGIDFKGPSGPITLWSVVFLAVSVALYAFIRL